MFYITISNGLLKDQHRRRMGTAVWEFMWCIDKVTKIDEKGVGWVLGGKPVNLKDLSKSMDVGEDTISINLSKLEEQGYITKLRTPYGIVIKVLKTKKRFGRNTDMGKTQNLRDSGKTPNLIEETPNVNKTVSVDIVAKTDELPLWLNKKAWGDWLKYNKEKKKKMPQSTIDLQIKKLEKFKNDHPAIIYQSIEKGWTGLFPIKKDYGNSDSMRFVKKQQQEREEREERESNEKDNEGFKKLNDDIKKLAVLKTI